MCGRSNRDKDKRKACVSGYGFMVRKMKYDCAVILDAGKESIYIQPGVDEADIPIQNTRGLQNKGE